MYVCVCARACVCLHVCIEGRGGEGLKGNHIFQLTTIRNQIIRIKKLFFFLNVQSVAFDQNDHYTECSE